MLLTRLAFTAGVMTAVVWLLLSGRFAEAILVVVLAVWLRRAVERGRLAPVTDRITRAR